MRRFSAEITEILEEVDTAQLSRPTLGGKVKIRVAKAIEALKDNEEDEDSVGEYLMSIATDEKNSTPMDVVRDFVDILNQAGKSNQPINGSALRELGRALNVKPGALDMLRTGDDKALAIKLIKRAYERQAKRR